MRRGGSVWFAEEAEIFSHHSPYRHRVRAIILLDAGLLTSARTIVVVAHFRCSHFVLGLLFLGLTKATEDWYYSELVRSNII